MTIRIVAEKKDKNLLIYISDDGKGMPQELADKLFHSTEKDRHSAGLGMALKNVNSRVVGYFGRRGNIKVKSEVGKGTTTTFIFPFSLTA